MTLKIAIIGCGVVGQGLMKILRDKKVFLRNNYGFEAEVVAISDKFKGSILVKEGIDLDALIKHMESTGKVDGFEAPGAITGLEPIETIRQSGAHIIAEASFTDIKTGEPATSHVREALGTGKHVVTTNKGPVALFFRELEALADQNNVQFRYEGAVMSGTPIFNLMEFCLAGNDVIEVKGILNGTTNFILTKMEEDDMAYEDALALAQKLGYAEADPTGDVEGYDALAKVMQLSNIVLGGNVTEADIEREGITGITSDMIKAAAAEGMRYKLIGSTRKEGGNIIAYVKPVKMPLSDPLAGVGGAINALTFSCDLSGDVTIQGPGAGQMETGFALLIDILAIHRAVNCC
ncbi:MAG: homoserine dehydrogenase [Thermoplasmata archaeon]|nr:homoserine dehydrogenase [Thermoplasmata archaeon]